MDTEYREVILITVTSNNRFITFTSKSHILKAKRLYPQRTSLEIMSIPLLIIDYYNLQ